MTPQVQEINALAWLFVAFILSYSFLLAPNYRGQWILFSDAEMSLRAHINYAFERVYRVIFVYILYQMFHNWRFKVMFWLQMGYLVDYLLIYNSPIQRVEFSWGYIPVGYSMFYGLSILFLMLNAIYKIWT